MAGCVAGTAGSVYCMHGQGANERGDRAVDGGEAAGTARGADGVEVTIVVLVVLAVGAFYGVGGYLLRDFGQQILTRDAATLGADLQARQEAALAEARTELERLRTDVRAATSEGDAQLARLRERRDSVQAELETTLARAREELARAERARQDAEREAERFRQEAERAAAVAPTANPGTAAAGDKAGAGLMGQVETERMETVTELYARLARVETALAQLTTPILLPGEPYEVPEEFLPEALRWDNWKDVGETAYSLGEYLTENRLRVSRQTARELEAGVTALRIALTRSIYPNLQTIPTAEQEATLRAGLDVLAQTLPRLRGLLETDYREMTEPAAGPERRSEPGGLS